MSTDAKAALDAKASAQSFSWGESYHLETDIRARVLAERIHWLLHIRWAGVVLCAAATVAAALHLPLRTDWRVFAGVGLFLAATNLVYRWATSRYPRKRRVLVAQMLTDFLALSALTYATGSLETPLPVLFIAHVILASLFFPPRVSLLMTGIGFVFALLPTALEATRVLPVRSLLDLPFKARLLADGRLPLLYAGVLAGGYLFCWYLTSTITSRLKQRELQLEESHRMLEELDREKTRATLRATHELKAPFAAIKSYVYSLRDGYCGDLPPKALEVVTRIGERCDRLANMITAIIHVGNMRTTVASDTDFEELDLATFLPPEVEEATILGQKRNIAVSSQIPAGAPLLIRAVPRHLHTLVSNLLRNAVTYSNDGGQVEASLHAAKKNVVLRVSDQGIGIAQENIPKIFDDFFRSNEAARVNPHGNGLGLTLVKEVAKLHGATIEVASEPGKGTCFWVWFARIIGREARSPQAAPSLTLSTQGGTDG